MSERTVTDATGRTWKCVAESSAVEGAAQQMGRDVILNCTTASVSSPVHVTVGWQWEKMAPNGLARMITLKSPVPKH